MTTGADRRSLEVTLARIGRRQTLRAVARGVAVGAGAAVLALGLALLLAGGSGGLWGRGLLALLCVAGGGAIGAFLHRRAGEGCRGAAARLEKGLPASRNLVQTAADLLHRSEPPAEVAGGRAATSEQARRAREEVIDQAARMARTADPAALVPLVGPTASALAAIGLVAVLLVAPSASVTMTASESAPGDGPAPDRSPVGATLTVRVHPPTWIGGAVESHESPTQLEVREGSRLEVEVRETSGTPQISQVRAETEVGAIELDEVDGAFTTFIETGGDGFLALEGTDASGRVRFQHLTGLRVLPDAPPTVEIRTPGRDLRFSDGDQRVEITVDARDDHALSELQLLYTRVSGFGELFEFLEDTIPLSIERGTLDSWTGRTTWSLAPLALERGELAVYHARARDRRPGAPWATSDSWVVEVLGAEAQAAGGFAGEDEMSRYAMSQQMVVVLIERLAAGRDTLASEDFLRESQQLAAAQRRVRAEFVFMLGGELEDEAHLGEDESEPDDHEHEEPEPDTGFTPLDPAAPDDLHEEAHARADQDAAEGRLAQQGRLELSRAVQAMAETAALLEAADLPPAHAAGERALTHLQQAFSSSRYILRALPEREELDLERRLSGSVDEAGSAAHPAYTAESDVLVRTLREVLTDLTAIGAEGTGDADLLLKAASRVLSAAPARTDYQAIAADLREASQLQRSGEAGVAERVAAATRALTTLLRSYLLPAPAGARSRELSRLEQLLITAGPPPR